MRRIPGWPIAPTRFFPSGRRWSAGCCRFPRTRAQGAGPAWTGYVLVDDVDVYAERAKAAGGAIHRAPEDIPGVGRFSVAADPHRAVFNLFVTASDEERAPAAPGTPGHVGWHELHAGDGPSAFAFYSINRSKSAEKVGSRPTRQMAL